MTQTKNHKYFAFKSSVVLLIIANCLSLFFFVRNHTYFNHDDYDHFVQVGSMPLLQMMMSPIDSHFVPLHKLFSAIIFKVFPLNFDMALVVMLAFHGAAIYMLYKLLQEIADTPWNLILILLYAGNIFIIDNLNWWSSGMLRFPYILLSITSLFFYLRFRKTNKPIFVFCSFAAFILALGFYVKAVFIPLYILSLELCLSHGNEFKQIIRRLRTGGFMLLITVAYVIIYIKFQTEIWKDEPLSPGIICETIYLNFKTLMSGLGLSSLYMVSTLFFLTACFLLACFILYTVKKARETWLIWTMLFVLLILNFAMIAASNRGQILGTAASWPLRYYLEVIFIIAIYAALMIRAIRQNSSNQDNGRLNRKIWVSFICCLIYVAFASSIGQKNYHKNYSIVSIPTAHYMYTLISDIEKLPKNRPLPFARACLPGYVYGGGFGVSMPMERILPARFKNLTFVPDNQAMYRVDENGHVKRIH